MSERTAPTAPDTTLRRLRALTAGGLLAMIVLGLVWELWLAPTGARTWAVKVLPLALALPGVLRFRMFTYRWLSLALWAYVGEGLVRGTTEHGAALPLAWMQVLLALAVFGACGAHVRWRLRAR